MSGHLTEILQNLTGNHKGRMNGYKMVIKDPGDEIILWRKDQSNQNIADNTKIKIVLEIPRDSRGRGNVKSKVFPGTKALRPEDIPGINIEYIPDWDENRNGNDFQRNGKLRLLSREDGRQALVFQVPAHHKTRQPGKYRAGHAHQDRYYGFAAYSMTAIRYFTYVLATFFL